MARTYVWEHWRELEYTTGVEFYARLLKITGFDKTLK